MPEAFVLGQVRTPRGKGSARGALAAIAPVVTSRRATPSNKNQPIGALICHA